MNTELSDIKRKVSTAETFLAKAKREYAYYLNGSPYPEGKVANDTAQFHYLESQKAYAQAKRYAEAALILLKKNSDKSLEQRAKQVLAACNNKKR